MAEFENREHYIPIRKSDLSTLLSKDDKLSAEERESFQKFCQLVGAVFHFEYLDELEGFKDAYAGFDPDRETKVLFPPSSDDLQQRQDRVFSLFVELMDKANFRHLSKADIVEAIEGGASDWGLDMDVDFDAFERLEVFVRGDTTGKRYKRSIWKFWKMEEKTVEMFQRLVVIIKLKKHKRLPAQVDTKGIYLKIFKDVPKLDMEMLLPGAQLRMPGFQKLTLGGSLLGGLAGLLWQIVGQIWAAIKGAFILGTAALGMMWGPIAALLGFGYKQWYSYSVAKQRYSLMLTESLYYQNLDNNVGVLTRLLDEAEEQECRETMLGYFFLWKHAPEEGWTADQLDDYIEMYIEGATELKVDFEIADALQKLERLKLVQNVNGNYRAVPIPQALERLDYMWDNYFQYNQEGASPSSTGSPFAFPKG